MKIDELVEKYMDDELYEDYEEHDLKKQGYTKTSSFGGGMSGKRTAGHVYTHPSGKKKVVMKKSVIDRVKHAAGEIKKKVTGG